MEDFCREGGKAEIKKTIYIFDLSAFRQFLFY